MKRILIVLGTFGVIAFALILGLSKINLETLKEWAPPQWKKFEELDLAEKSVLQYDSVYGTYLQWSGRKYLGPGNPECITRKVLLDRPNRFAIKAIFKDTTGFFTKIPGDINFSGQWTEENEKLILKFYFAPVTWYQLFDSLKNDKAIRLIDRETIEIDKNTERIWVMDTECKKLR